MSLLLSTKRRVVQLAALIVLNTNLWAVSAAERFCLPVMNCEACAFAWMGCPIGMMARVLAFGEFPLAVLAMVLGLGLLIGRFLCGWVCPLGFLQDLLHKIPFPKFRLRRYMTYPKYAFLLITAIAVPYFIGAAIDDHEPPTEAAAGLSEPEAISEPEAGVSPEATPKPPPSQSDFEVVEEAPSDFEIVPSVPSDFEIVDPAPSDFEVVDAPQGEAEAGYDAENDPLAGPLHLEPAYTTSPLFFCNLCPTAALQVVIPSMIADRDIALDFGRILRFTILLLVLVAAMGNHRSFCKIMCPIGALIAVTNKFSFLSLRLKKDACIHCHKCNKSCPMGVKVEESQDTTHAINRDTECIECLTCEQSCPTTAITNNSRVLKK